MRDETMNAASIGGDGPSGPRRHTVASARGTLSGARDTLSVDRAGTMGGWAPARIAAVAGLLLLAGACSAGRPAATGTLPNPVDRADVLRSGTRLTRPTRIEFRWALNESGSRVNGIGIARVEPPYRARLDLFLDNGEGVVTAALVDDDLRLPVGAPDDVLPPVELMWGTLGVFRPLDEARLVGGETLDSGGERLRYDAGADREIHFEVDDGRVRGLELLQGTSVVEWVRVTPDETAWPVEATYRNLRDFRELRITRTLVMPADAFDPSIWDPRG